MTEDRLIQLNYNRASYKDLSEKLRWFTEIRKNYNTGMKDYLTITDNCGIQRDTSMSTFESDFILEIRDTNLCMSLLNYIIDFIKSEMNKLDMEFNEA